MSDINLSISKEVVTPIVEAQIKGAVLSALGGSTELIERVVNHILFQKVDKDGKTSSYSSDNKFTWIDMVLTKTIQQAAEEAIKVELVGAAKQIKDVLVRQLQSKKGSELAAKALLSALNGSFEKSWKSSIKIDLSPLSSE